MITDEQVQELANIYQKSKHGKVDEDSYHCIKVNSRKNTNGNIVIIVLSKKKKSPIFVIKIPRNPDFIDNVVNENYGLNNAIGMLDNKLDFIGPEHSIITELDGCNILLQDACSGEPILAKYSNDESIVKYQYSLFMNLLKFSLSGHKKEYIRKVELEKYINELLEDLNDLSPEAYSGISRNFKSVLKSIPESLEGNRCAYLHQHGDYNPYNALISGDKIKIVDWEDYREKDIPVIDLNHLFVCSSYLYGSHSDSVLNKYITNILNPGRYREIFIDCVSKYCQEIKLEENAFWMLSNIYYLIMAVSVCRDGRQEEFTATSWINMGNLYADNYKSFIK